VHQALEVMLGLRVAGKGDFEGAAADAAAAAAEEEEEAQSRPQQPAAAAASRAAEPQQGGSSSTVSHEAAVGFRARLIASAAAVAGCFVCCTVYVMSVSLTTADTSSCICAYAHIVLYEMLCKLLTG
jgi:hypothetical protein